MKPAIQLRPSQQLALTPQLQQSIRLLQLSTLELQQEVQQALQDNPLLERLDDPMDLAIRLRPDGALVHTPAGNTSSSDVSSSAENPHEASHSEGSDPDYSTFETHRGEESIGWESEYRNPGSQDDDEGQVQLEIAGESLRDYLLIQAQLNTHTERDAALLCLLIEALDDNGYLDESLEHIHAGLPDSFAVVQDDLVFALNLLQSFEPAGVGARNVSECLAIQIKRLPNVATVTRKLALTIADSYLPQLAQHDFNKIKKATGCDDEDLKEAQDVIQQCQPHPGNHFNQDRIDFVAPDVIVTKTDEGWQARLNQAVMPKLQINSLYASVLQQHKQATSLQTQLQEARWLIKNIQQRFETILRVSQAIIDRQRSFFAHGAIAMRPLILREIADTLGLHESTISRVSNQKYMLTPHGMFELKYFFDSHIGTQSGGEASSIAIKALIKELIRAENQTSPLSDSQITRILGEQGMVIARRTVAKYREALNIPSVTLRKIL